MSSYKIVSLPHLILTVNNFEKAKEFYKVLYIDYLGAEIKHETDDFFYFSINNDISLGISTANSEFQNEKFNRFKVGLHHFALELKSKQEIDEVYVKLVEFGANILDKPAFYPDYGDFYYAVYFEDLD